MLTLAILALVPTWVPALDPAPPQKAKRSETRAKLEALYEKRDREGCIALWRENIGLALPTIDEDLEGGLRIEETAKEPDAAKIALMRARAVWAAGCAAEAIGHPLIADYAASFAGWTSTQKKFFREEQAIYRKAMEWIEKGENRQGLETAQECVQRALQLGDHWGAAMGYEACGVAHQAKSALDDALAAWSQARILNHDLGLVDSEIECLKSMADMCFAVDRPLRGREIAQQALAIARKRGDKALQADFLTRRASFEEKLGDKTSADATRLEAQSLGK